MPKLLRGKASQWGVIGLFALVAVLTFTLQSYNVGFWGVRHGWTSSHSLAIMRRAVPENRFVGYALAFRDESGAPVYEYFDRYPVFFSAITNGVLSLFDDLPTQIYASRQYMNVILLLTMWLAYRLARLYLDNRYLAFAVTVLAFSSYYFLYYKDMPDFHPPVVLGFLAVYYSVARYKLYGERWQIYAVSIGAVLLAFGYAVMFALACWLAIDGVRVLARTGQGLRQKLADLLRLDALWVVIIGTALSAGAILYNVAAEAALRGVSIRQTSVIDSILRRIPFLEGAVSEVARDQVALAGMSGWVQFFIVEFERVIKWSLPLKTSGPTGIRFLPGESQMEVSWWVIAFGVVASAWLARFIWQQKNGRRDVALLAVISPLVFLFSMINLTSVHDFVTMFAMSFSVMMWVALLRPAARSRMIVGLLVVAGLGLYAASNVMVRQAHNADLVEGAPWTYDFERIRTSIEGEDNTIFYDYPKHCIIRNWQCYALGYYLGNNFLTQVYPLADYVLSPRPYYTTERFVDAGDTLMLIKQPTNPENEVTHLLDVNTAEPRTAPEANAPMFRFGDEVTLQSWTLDGSVTLRACERVVVESWWLAEDVPSDNLNMQVVMIDANGGSITEANSPLGAVPTSIWETDRFTIDARTVSVPCDTPPGEYPLIMGVYNPNTLEPLPVFDADGNPVGNQIYLTTLFVE